MLTGCSFAPVVSEFSVSYDGSLEDANNQLLVVNVLRASNRAPLYFSDLSIIRGALTATLSSQLTAPFGEGKLTSTKHFGEVANATLQTAPNFEVHPLNQQDFTQGILRPIELQYGKTYWDRVDYPEFLLALLFVDKIEVRFFKEDGTPELILLSPDGTSRKCVPQLGCPGTEGDDNRPVDTFLNQPDNQKNFENFKRIIGNWGVIPGNPRTERSVTYHSYLKLTPVTESVQENSIKDFSGLDPRKIRARKRALSAAEPVTGMRQATPEMGDKSRTETGELFELAAVEDRIIICPPRSFLDIWARTFDISIVAPQISGTTVDETPQPAEACEVAEWPGGETGQPGPSPQPRKKQMQIKIYTRSVEGMIQYLGAIVRKYGESPDNPIRFFIHRGSISEEKVSLLYEGRSYAVGPYRDDDQSHLGEDNTLPILGLVQQLLNLRKSSKEIINTSAVILP
jgi:hypothetical protein